jgi:hypothetical protein
VSVSLTLDPKKVFQDEDAEEELDQLVHEFHKIAEVTYRKGLAIISLICNVERTSVILQRVRRCNGTRRCCCCRRGPARGGPGRGAGPGRAGRVVRRGVVLLRCARGACCWAVRRSWLQGSGQQRCAHAHPLPLPRPQVFQVLAAEGINMQMLSQGSSKTNISMVVDGKQSQRVVQLLHREFFEQQDTGNPEHN